MNLGDNALQVLKTVAPLLATTLGGPVAGVATKALTDALGTKPDDQAAAEQALLGATPDQLLALKKANDDFTLQMKQLGVQEEQLAYADTASARQREAAVKDWTPRILGVGVVVLTLGLEGAMLLG